MQTVASRLLREKCVPDTDWSQANLARKLGVKRQAVAQWLSGVAQPKPRIMARLEDLLDIPMRAWTQRNRAATKRTGTDG